MPYTEEGTNITITGNVAPWELTFQSLVKIAGRVTLTENSILGVNFPLLTEVTGGFFLSNQDIPSLALPSLQLINGYMALVENPGLITLGITSLLAVPGLLVVSSNFPLFNQSEVNLLINTNAVLARVAFPMMNFFGGIIIIRDNPALTFVDLGVLNGMNPTSSIEISGSALQTLDLRTVACTAIFSIILVNNPVLATVYIADPTCQRQILSENNPVMRFVY